MKQIHKEHLILSGDATKDRRRQEIMISLAGVNVNLNIAYISNFTEDELNKAHSNVALTSSKHFNLFKPNFKLELINKLLVSVAWGEQDKVERLLKTSPELMLERTTFTDCSGRIFENISAFEFALWAWDTRYMVNMMLNCLPDGALGFSIAEALKEQYHNVALHGVTYTLNGQRITEKHFDFSGLEKALQTYVDNHDDWSKELLQLQNHWCMSVGMAQRYVPAHVMQHYCDPERSFCSTPSFTAKTFKRSLRFYHFGSHRSVALWSGSLVSGNLVLGVNFGISRRALNANAFVSVGREDARADLNAIVRLRNVREKDFCLLESRLEKLCQNQDRLKNSNNCVIS